jgi:hypothetical protein
LVQFDTPFSLLNPKGSLLSTISFEYEFFAAARQSLSPHISVEQPVPVDLVQFCNLAASIQARGGDVTDFSGEFGCSAIWGNWIRVRAADVLRRILQGTLPLPGLSPSRPMGSTQILSMEDLYYNFFIGQVLPYYVYLYSKDLRMESYTLPEEEQDLLRSFSYYDFVSFITYMGSLLLQAAHRYSRVLYEGVRLMLIRAYVALGIIPWYPHLTEPNPSNSWVHEFEHLVNELPHSQRLCLTQSPGDAYAHHGWEIFKRRPNALWTLSYATHLAIFTADMKVDNSIVDFNPYYVSGVIPYSFPEDFLLILTTVRYAQNVVKFYASTESRRVSFYKCPPKLLNEPDVTHEWYIISDLLYPYSSSRVDDDDIFKVQELKIERCIKDKFNANISAQYIREVLSFPTLLKFGLKVNVDVIPNTLMISFSQYVRTRYSISLNKLIYYIIPKSVNRELQQRIDSQLITSGLSGWNSLSYSTETIGPTKSNLERVCASLQQKLGATNPASDEYGNLSRGLLACQTDLDVVNFQASFITRLNFIMSEPIKKSLHLDTFKFRLLPKSVPGHWSILFELSSFLRLLESLQGSKHGAALYSAHTRHITERANKKNIADLVALQESPTFNLKGRRPSLLIFALKSVSSGYTPVFMSLVRDRLYIGFDPSISDPLSQYFKSIDASARSLHIYDSLPGYQFMITSWLSDIKVQEIIASFIVEPTQLFGLMDFIKQELITPVHFKELMQTGVAPDWMNPFCGATSITEFLLMYGDDLIPIDITKHLLTVYPIKRDSEDIQHAKQLKQEEVEKAKERLAKKRLDALMFKTGHRGYVPGIAASKIRFTKTEDMAIMSLYNPFIREEQRDEILRICSGREWEEISRRARRLTRKMVEDDKVFDVNVLPMHSYTTSLKKALLANFEAALNVDARLKVDDNENTVEALKARYLTPKLRRPKRV